MKYINLFFLLSVLAPMAVRADGCFFKADGNWSVPFQRIYDAVQKQPQLHDSDFVFLLGDRVTDKKYTLQKVAQACIDYADYNNAVTDKICTDFVAAAFGPSGAPTTATEESDGNVILTTTDMPEDEEIKITIHAEGQFSVDCDNGGPVQTIDNTIIRKADIACKYPTGGVHEIEITGRATGYPYLFGEPGVIYFNKSPYLKSVQGSLGSIFPTLGDDKQPRFGRTFLNCNNLTEIPADLFSGVTGAESGMFYDTFKGCSALTTIPDGLFDGVKGAANSMFSGTFEGCSALTTIPADLFDGVKGAKGHMFYGTFQNCSALMTIPADLFDGVKGAAKFMFDSTFEGCSALTTIPAGLFSGVTGAANGMFGDTFEGCSALTTIPDGLFSGVTGAAKSMFWGTFSDCTGLTEIPTGLFDGVTGAAEYMFRYTFKGCTSLTTIPEDLFKGVTGTADAMFDNTFLGVPDNVIPAGLFPGVTGATESGQSDSADTATKKSDAATTATEESGGSVTAAGGGNVTLTTTNMPVEAEIKITIYAAGQFSVDCDNGGPVYTINNTDVVKKDIACKYPTGGKHDIEITGRATGYQQVFGEPGVIYFNESQYLESVQGSLGSIFPTLGDDKQPQFASTFQNCSALTEIPADLFDGVTGAAVRMFLHTFWGCSALTDIPADLFSGVTGTADDMFRNTFFGVPSEEVPLEVKEKMVGYN